MRTALSARHWLPVAILLVLAGCQDPAAPVGEHNVAANVVRPPVAADLPMLRQARTAPPLETYQVSFWARNAEPSTVVVNYRPATGEWMGRPFLTFAIPRGGLQTGPDGQRLGGRDSVYITLTIDPARFLVHFEPSGLVFSGRHPATLTFSYENANPDANGDGVVDSTDRMLGEYIAIWVRTATPAPWVKTSSNDQTGQHAVSTDPRHFSEYAVSW